MIQKFLLNRIKVLVTLTEILRMAEVMDVDVDKSEDELELERLVFGDAEGIKERLKGKKDSGKAIQRTDLEHLEDDQVTNFLCRQLTTAILH